MSKIKKGDKVKVILGRDSGKEGEVQKVLPKKSQVIVSGVNVYKRHVRKTQGIEGGTLDIIKPVDISNVVLICPNCKKPTRVGFKISGKTKLRICKKCKKEIT